MGGEVVSVAQARGFDEFYQACYGRLLRQVALVTTNLADAEDVLQEAFARAAIRWRQLETYDAPEAWVLRVAMNLAADTTRRLRRRAAAMLRLGPPPTQPELSADTVDLIRALRALPLGQRQAIVLHHLVGLSVEEISRQLGVPSGTVKARLARGRTALARRLGTDYYPAHRETLVDE
jgi:RNA polymerase sigma-70 factor (ECF subfamily)